MKIYLEILDGHSGGKPPKRIWREDLAFPLVVALDLDTITTMVTILAHEDPLSAMDTTAFQDIYPLRTHRATEAVPRCSTDECALV